MEILAAFDLTRARGRPPSWPGLFESFDEALTDALASELSLRRSVVALASQRRLELDRRHEERAGLADRLEVAVQLDGACAVAGELFGLTVDRVDFLRASVRIDQQLARVRGSGVGLAPLKTEASYRSLPLPSVVASALAAHLTRWPAHPDLGVIFTNERGGPVQQHPFACVWETARAERGYRSGRPRTTFGTSMRRC
jgi:hypothetical protein